MPEDFLDLAKKYESGGKNILNYLYDPTHTAGGYWQITDTNWRAYAPKVGIDINKYPTAISMKDEEQQRKVADYILNNTPKGIRNWTDYNPKLKAALEGHVPSQQQESSGYTREEIEAEIKRRMDLLQSANPQAYRSVFDPQGSPGELEKWATESDKPQSLMQALGDVGPFGPALRAGTRAVMGYNAGNSRAYDIAKSARGLGETAASVLPLGAQEIPSMSQFVKSLLGAAVGGYGARKGAEYLGASPETQDVAQESGSILGGVGGPVAIRKPSISGIRASLVGDILSSPRSKALTGSTLGYRARQAHELLFPDRGPEPTATVGDIGTTGKGAAPQTRPLPRTPEEDELLKLGAMTEEQYLSHMKTNLNLDDEAAQIKLGGARARALRDELKEASKNAGTREAQSPVTIRPTGSQPPLPGVNVTPPPGTQAVPNPQGNLFNQQPQQPQQQSMFPPQQQMLPGMRVQPPPNAAALAPTQQPLNLGQPPAQAPPEQMGLNFPQGPQQELPFEQQRPQVAAPPPPRASGLTGIQQQLLPQLGTAPEYRPFSGTTMGKMATQRPLDLTVKAPGELMQQLEIPKPYEGPQTKLDLQTPEQVQKNVRDLRDAIISRPDVRVGKWRYNTAEKAERLSRRLGLKFVAKPEDFDAALDLIADQKRNARPTTSMPGKEPPQ